MSSSCQLNVQVITVTELASVCDWDMCKLMSACVSDLSNYVMYVYICMRYVNV